MQSNADGIELAHKVIFSDAVMAGDPKLADAGEGLDPDA